MAKGLFTQSACLLTDGGATIEAVEAALREAEFDVVKQTPANEHWQFGGAGLVLEYLPEANGYAVVDVVDQCWPDGMGDPKNDPMTFGAWSTGQFGPFAFPGNLTRASEHSWGWADGKKTAAAHRGFIRIRISYGFGAEPDQPVLPDDYDPLAEMLFLSQIVLALFDVPGVLCYFNPNGEVLRDGAGFGELWEACMDQEKIPLPLWMNIRFFKLSDTVFLMDTVGNQQLDVRDVEAVFLSEANEPQDVDYYLRNVTQYLLGLDRELQTGEEIDGPGESDASWAVQARDDGAAHPPRRVFRLFPNANSNAIQQALAAAGLEV
jgi:hypothetical protein